MIGATDREDRQLSSPRSSLYRGPAEQPSASPAISASPALCIVPRGSTAAARKVTEGFSLARIEIGGGGPGGPARPPPAPPPPASPPPRRGGARGFPPSRPARPGGAGRGTFRSTTSASTQGCW